MTKASTAALLKRGRPAALLFAASLLAFAAAARAEYEQSAAGFVYVSASNATLHAEAKADSKAMGIAPRGGRLVYRKMIVGDDGKPAWYHAEPPGSAAGWVPASEVSVARPTALPPGKPLKLVDTGLQNAHPAASMTGGANGMDDRAVRYGMAQNLEVTINQFLTMEKAIEALYQDPHDARGGYPEDHDNPVRKDKAAAFRAGLAKEKAQ